MKKYWCLVDKLIDWSRHLVSGVTYKRQFQNYVEFKMKKYWCLELPSCKVNPLEQALGIKSN